MNALGKEFRKIRYSIGFSQREAALTIGLGESCISDIENGYRSMKPALIKSASITLACPERGLSDASIEYRLLSAKVVDAVHGLLKDCKPELRKTVFESAVGQYMEFCK